MSFIKIYKKDWSILRPPSSGSFYLGYDISDSWGYGVNTLLQMDSSGIVVPIFSGSTVDGSSGSSGTSGTDGTDGTFFGSSGSSGSSGIDGF